MFTFRGLTRGSVSVALDNEHGDLFCYTGPTQEAVPAVATTGNKWTEDLERKMKLSEPGRSKLVS